MSFVLEFRRSYFLEPARAKAAAEARARKAKRRVAEKPKPPAHLITRKARRGMLLALMTAALILAVFNSEGMKSYAWDLAEQPMFRPVLVLAEGWDRAMEKLGAKALMADLQDIASTAQAARWSDVAGLFRRGEADDAIARGGADPMTTGSLPAAASDVPGGVGSAD
ncbi:hypothetical protein V6C03_00980 [Methyloligella sp. 2.7D]|uniref:hypothetical protein n=1 Tax=unclassified Methyloligella TaxID=2625955 RepID=UPI00157D4EE4|nr:hypothetical protein [Methyloligella sp. GL2]QKP76763.1 hypothetical protein HT051_04435 [Methyloligella sp. GL2]